MMAGLNNNVFHIEFGFNETELTSLLEAGSYGEAEKLILQNAHESYLDEGCYERTPLNIVLSGRNNINEGQAVRNLHIAKCLVQHGASPNYRVPKTDFGYYLSPGETPLELLVNFYNRITAHETCVQALEEADVYRTKHEIWDAKLSPVIGMNQKYIASLENLKEKIQDLVFIMLSHGGDSNVLNEFRQTLLHRTIAYSTDAAMVECLWENGADINAVDVYGNTSLIYACRYCQLAPYHMGEINDYDENPLVWVKRTIENCCYSTKNKLIQTLLQFGGIQLDSKNKHGKTALFYCMERGDWKNALLLLEKGCSVTDQGTVSELDDFYKATSPLYISLYSSRCMNYFMENYMTESKLQCPSSHVFPVALIDPGYFDHDEITAELYGDIEENMHNINVLRIRQLGHQVLHLLYGHATCTLRQLCSRQIFLSWINKFSQTVFSMPDSDDSLCSSGNPTSSLIQDAVDQSRSNDVVHTAAVGVPINDETVILSSFQPLHVNSSPFFGESSLPSTSGSVEEDSGNSANIAENQVQSITNQNENYTLKVIEELEETENESETEISDTEEDYLLKKEINDEDNKKNVSNNSKPQDETLSTTKQEEHSGDSSDRISPPGNQRRKSSSSASSSDDSSMHSSISRISSVHWPTRFSDVWKHLGKITAADLDKELVSVLHLPKDTLICFEVELLRISLFLSRVTRYHRTCDWQMMDRIYGRGSNEPSSDGSVSDEDESGDEYW